MYYASAFPRMYKYTLHGFVMHSEKNPLINQIYLYDIIQHMMPKQKPFLAMPQNINNFRIFKITCIVQFIMPNLVNLRKKKVKPQSQAWLIAAGAYPGFCSIKRLKVFLLSLDGMLVHRRSLPPQFCQVSPTIRWYPFIHLSALTMRPPRLPLKLIKLINIYMGCETYKEMCGIVYKG